MLLDLRTQQTTKLVCIECQREDEIGPLKSGIYWTLRICPHPTCFFQISWSIRQRARAAFTSSPLPSTPESQHVHPLLIALIICHLMFYDRWRLLLL
jgi:hypothetical protein